MEMRRVKEYYMDYIRNRGLQTIFKARDDGMVDVFRRLIIYVRQNYRNLQ